MKQEKFRRIVSICVALIWLANGLFCKVFGLVPRHEQIVASILGEEHAVVLTILIGLGETIIGIWVLSGLQTQLVVFVQVLLIACMNLLEFFLVPELLLWGRWNAVFAVLLIAIILLNEFGYRKHLAEA